jgi:hypothetical protein
MCDYSLMHIASRKAEVGDKLVTTQFANTVSRGFAAVGDCNTAVCVIPGTEVGFSAPIKTAEKDTEYSVAIFRQLNVDQPFAHHDNLELPNGEYILLTHLSLGQEATVLQMPPAPKNEAEAKEQTRLEVVA